MAIRLTPKSTFRGLAVCYDGSNYPYILDFCKFTYYSNEQLFIRYNNAEIPIKEGMWIVQIDDNNFVPMTDEVRKSIFK